MELVRWLLVDYVQFCITNADVKNAWSYTPLPIYIMMAWCLIN